MITPPRQLIETPAHPMLHVTALLQRARQCAPALHTSWVPDVAPVQSIAQSASLLHLKAQLAERPQSMLQVEPGSQVVVQLPTGEALQSNEQSALASHFWSHWVVPEQSTWQRVSARHLEVHEGWPPGHRQPRA